MVNGLRWQNYMDACLYQVSNSFRKLTCEERWLLCLISPVPPKKVVLN